ncbi:hypothetical protein F4824DRAFT_446263 [Ustulina deusta]|nr:hypothetical protein F4824DRAFT_446263 [Ustulina deusta]
MAGHSTMALRNVPLSSNLGYILQTALKKTWFVFVLPSLLFPGTLADVSESCKYYVTTLKVDGFYFYLLLFIYF